MNPQSPASTVFLKLDTYSCLIIMVMLPWAGVNSNLGRIMLLFTPSLLPRTQPIVWGNTKWEWISNNNSKNEICGGNSCAWKYFEKYQRNYPVVISVLRMTLLLIIIYLYKNKQMSKNYRLTCSRNRKRGFNIWLNQGNSIVYLE